MSDKNFKNLIFDSFEKYLQISLSDEKLEMFSDYASLLKETNKVMNLTSIVDDEEIAIKHFVDSCFLIKTSPFNKNDNIYHKTDKSAIDVGTGAGFPGIPMAILCENMSFVLTDSLNKRLRFLDDVINKLSIKNVKTIHARAEDLGHDNNYREKFDFAFARGVSKLSVLFEYLSPFVKVGGNILAHKLSNIDNEISESENAIDKLCIKYENKYEYYLIDGEPKRAIFDFKKIKNLNKVYPRKAGVPVKNPL